MADIVQPNGAVMTPMEMQIQQAAIDRQRAIATALQQESLTPAQGQMISGHYVAPSPLQYLAKIAQGLAGSSRQTDLDQQARNIATMQGNMVRDQFGIGGQGQSQGQDQSQSATPPGMGPGWNSPSLGAQAAAGNPNGVVPAPAPPLSSSGMNGSRILPGMSGMQAFIESQANPTGYSNAILKQYEQPDAVKTNNYYGLDRASVGDAMARKNAIEGHESIRAEQTLLGTDRNGKTTPLFTGPNKSSYTTWTNGVPQANEIPGAAAVAENMARAEQAGRGSVMPYSGRDANGNPLPVTNVTAAATQGSAPASVAPSQGTSGVQQGLDLSKLSPQQIQVLAKQDPVAFAKGVQDFQQTGGASAQVTPSVAAQNAKQPIYAEPPLGKQVGAENLAIDNAKTWSAQKSRAAQSTGDIALANIMEPLLDKFTSGKGAQNMADWKSFAATQGIPVDKDATDAAQEFKKYASQLIAQQRAAMGGNGSDAAQAMQEAGSANMGIGNDPNKNILQYIRANAQGMNAFANAKTNYLKSTGNDMVNASDFDNKWNQFYDPRILMYKNMQPAQKQKFVNELTKYGQIDDFQRKLGDYNSLVNTYK